ncbi:cytochrome c-type biogenesis CcmF C-terminal domain-containing protein, partial [Deinococcus sp. 23YEL01]|uniref:cytochrome c-type biogenesis CcmF C-terminal domain-containing protein n=1 Tax=Deinococcus sp. 23YEL01 TaxID=2745871 RepID=UPI002714626A
CGTAGRSCSAQAHRDAQVTLNLNAAPVRLLNEQLQLTDLRTVRRSDGAADVATVQIDGRPFQARLNTYTQGGDTAFPSPAVRYGPLGDTYVVMTSVDPQGQWASVRLIESPLVSWIWWGTLIVCVGASFTLVSPRRAAVRAPSGLAPATD